ncbi:hypothetical protein GCM10010495_35590 [Kitasatospora herbaricolor]|nr:hypothetical protein GCM10010495_35590 [Kitasatospora herbaricolor]
MRPVLLEPLGQHVALVHLSRSFRLRVLAVDHRKDDRGRKFAQLGGAPGPDADGPHRCAHAVGPVLRTGRARGRPGHGGVGQSSPRAGIR